MSSCSSNISCHPPLDTHGQLLMPMDDIVICWLSVPEMLAKNNYCTVSPTLFVLAAHLTRFFGFPIFWGGENAKKSKWRRTTDLQLPMTSGHDCQSMGKLRSIMGHLALIVNLKIISSCRLFPFPRNKSFRNYRMEYVTSPCSEILRSLLGLNKVKGCQTMF